MDTGELKGKIRDIKDFPTEGILFKDITTLLKDGPAFRYVIDTFVQRYRKERVDVVVGIESRGFILGGALAHQLNAGFVPVRKLGKLPGKTIEVEYELEYGRDALAVHEDAIKPGQRVLAVDDLLATGGTMGATLRLIRQLGDAAQRRGADHRVARRRVRSGDERARTAGASFGRRDPARRKRPLRRGHDHGEKSLSSRHALRAAVSARSRSEVSDSFQRHD